MFSCSSDLSCLWNTDEGLISPPLFNELISLKLLLHPQTSLDLFISSNCLGYTFICMVWINQVCVFWHMDSEFLILWLENMSISSKKIYRKLPPTRSDHRATRSDHRDIYFNAIPSVLQDLSVRGLSQQLMLLDAFCLAMPHQTSSFQYGMPHIFSAPKSRGFIYLGIESALFQEWPTKYAYMHLHYPKLPDVTLAHHVPIKIKGFSFSQVSMVSITKNWIVLLTNTDS